MSSAPWIQFRPLKSYFFNNHFNTSRNVRWKDKAKSPTNYSIPTSFPFLSNSFPITFICRGVKACTCRGCLTISGICQAVRVVTYCTSAWNHIASPTYKISSHLRIRLQNCLFCTFRFSDQNCVCISNLSHRWQLPLKSPNFGKRQNISSTE